MEMAIFKQTLRAQEVNLVCYIGGILYLKGKTHDRIAETEQI